MKRILLIAAMAAISAAAMAQPKFAHVNFTELVQLAPEADQARSAMNLSSNEAQETLNAMIEEYQTKYQQYQQKGSTWTPAILESKERELTEIQERIQQFQQSVQAELQQQQQQLLAPIYEKAQNVINDLAKAGGYIYVFDISSALYIDDTQSVDLTKEARKSLGIAEDRTLESLQAELQAQAEAAQQQ